MGALSISEKALLLYMQDLVLALDVGRRGWPDLEVDEELGAGPRPTSPNDKVSISRAPLLRF
jgi:hypothetical protein